MVSGAKVFDRASSAALKSDPKTGEVLEWNPVFADVTQRMGLGVDLCWPGRPNQKGAVESLVGWVKGSFFKVRRFRDRADLEAQLARHVFIGCRTICRTFIVRPEGQRQERHARYSVRRVLTGVSVTNLHAGPTLATAPMISSIAAALR